MKPQLSLVASTLSLLPVTATGKRLHGRSKTEPGCCTFTLASTGSFACPASQLDDGQIRLNGTGNNAEFCIDKDGGITDSNGFGCIVTEAPITQIQCDQGKSPTTGFSIGPDKGLLYNGSPSFYACPATDTEYNIYVAPDFGQTKCFPISLAASNSDCAADATCPTYPPETVWETQWVTEATNYTVTWTQTTWLPCPVTTTSASSSTSSSVGWNGTSTTACHKCTQETGTGSWTTHTTTAELSTGIEGHSTAGPKQSRDEAKVGSQRRWFWFT